MALATIDDVAAVGGIPVDASFSDAQTQRAERLIGLASGLVLAYFDQFGVSEFDVDGWENWRRDALTAIVAEVAAKRLNVAAAPNVDPYGTVLGPQTIKLNRWEQDALRDLLPGGGGSSSISLVVERDYSWISGVETTPTSDPVTDGGLS